MTTSKLTEEQCKLLDHNNVTYKTSNEFCPIPSTKDGWTWFVDLFTQSEEELEYDWGYFLHTNQHKDWHSARPLASDWRTCPCSYVPHTVNADMTPKDEELKQLGLDFHSAIFAKDVRKAREVLESIVTGTWG